MSLIPIRNIAEIWVRELVCLANTLITSGKLWVLRIVISHFRNQSSSFRCYSGYSKIKVLWNTV